MIIFESFSPCWLHIAAAELKAQHTPQFFVFLPQCWFRLGIYGKKSPAAWSFGAKEVRMFNYRFC
jgi:hypothetical protein